MTRGKKALLGCLAIPFVLLLMVMVLVGISFVLPAHEPAIVERTVDQHIGSALADVAGGSEGFRFGPGETKATAVTIDVEEGNFEIVPGEAGGDLHIEATYDEKMYELAAEAEGANAVAVRFQRKGGPLRLFTHIRRSDLEDNVIRIYLPVDSPVELKIRVRRADARIDLTDVPVRDLDLNVAMGSTRVRFDDPNPVPLARLRARSRMGELRLIGLGHAGPRELDVSGTMGEHHIDFGGALLEDTSARLKVRMGEMKVVVPSTITTRVAERRVSMGDLRADAVTDRPGDGLGPTLELALDVKMGELSVQVSAR